MSSIPEIVQSIDELHEGLLEWADDMTAASNKYQGKVENAASGWTDAHGKRTAGELDNAAVKMSDLMWVGDVLTDLKAYRARLLQH